eukprot:CAMPEP_0118651528 /NCGR_PEP_ID=MMETSP0785-20121206/10834_1 /TAXON_ID=91992 /ORGANISM="Bolidomonas pacifica, Strain CCMP 1866" /LENGTH=810 /DNA_ID=CAMNT_0006543987 /DNA_START=233 /DNA_END=2662 /DNA_ORIENTATION=+
MSSRNNNDRSLSLIDESIDADVGMPNPVSQTRSLERINSIGKMSSLHPLSASGAPTDDKLSDRARELGIGEPPSSLNPPVNPPVPLCLPVMEEEDGPPQPPPTTFARHPSEEKLPKPHHFPNPHLSRNPADLETSIHLGSPGSSDLSGPTALSFTRTLMFYGHGAITEENVAACVLLQEARTLRKKYFSQKGCNYSPNVGDAKSYRFGADGLLKLFSTPSPSPNDGDSLCYIPSIFEFMNDYTRLKQICSDGATRSFSFQRLQLLSSAFKTHVIANGHVELEAQSRLLGTDFYRTKKVDNHIHLAAAASAKQFVDFVREKLETEPDTVVLEEGDTLKEVFDKAGLDADHLTIDAFNVLADYSVYQRFDNFNSKYSPFKLAQMRRIFLKVDNAIQGRYFAELTKRVLARHEAGKGHESLTEMRLSVYGMERGEWLQNAKWVLRDWKGPFPGPILSSKNKWMVQIPRLWRIFRKKHKNNESKSFNSMLENIFTPMIEATLNPEAHPEVAELLKHIVGIDSVDDEGNPEAPCGCTSPSEWKQNENPSYAWQLYYLWGNIKVVNSLRKARGLNTFAFRPHSGETGDVMHLAATYLLCESVNHGINLDKQVSLQYLYYLDQVGLSVAPLSNNFLFRKMKDNPFSKFFRRGMNVALSTDDPLLFHMSDDPLLEEYSVARASFDLSMTDMCEIARNSVMQSGFSHEEKKEWLGTQYLRGVKHCDVLKTHVPLIRAKFRAEHLALEHMMLKLFAKGTGEEVLYAMMQQFQWSRDAHRKILFDNFIEVPDGETIWKPGQGNDTESDGKSEEAGINDGKE